MDFVSLYVGLLKSSFVWFILLIFAGDAVIDYNYTFEVIIFEKTLYVFLVTKG